MKDPINSSHIAAVEYDPGNRTMDVHFAKGGVYRYHGVPSEVHQGLKNSDSAGNFHHRNIKGQYRHERVS